MIQTWSKGKIACIVRKVDKCLQRSCFL